MRLSDKAKDKLKKDKEKVLKNKSHKVEVNDDGSIFFYESEEHKAKIDERNKPIERR